MKILIYLLFFAVAFILCVRLLEWTSVFYPARELDYTPDFVGLSFEEIAPVTEDQVKLHGWFMPREGASLTVLYLHGNAGNIGDRVWKLKFLHDLNVNVCIIDYRGYGQSQGRPTERGLYLDALAAYDYLVGEKMVRPEDVVVYGGSLGGAVAVDLARKRQVGGVIIDSSFSRAADMARRMYPFVPSFLLSVKLDSLSKIRNVDVPKLFIHSRSDHVVPFELGQKLYDAAPEPKAFFEAAGSHVEGHIFSQDGMKKALLSFFEQVRERKAPDHE